MLFDWSFLKLYEWSTRLFLIASTNPWYWMPKPNTLPGQDSAIMLSLSSNMPQGFNSLNMKGNYWFAKRYMLLASLWNIWHYLQTNQLQHGIPSYLINVMHFILQGNWSIANINWQPSWQTKLQLFPACCTGLPLFSSTRIRTWCWESQLSVMKISEKLSSNCTWDRRVLQIWALPRLILMKLKISLLQLLCW